LGRESIGITRLSVFLSRRSFLINKRRFLEALVRGRPFMAFSSVKSQSDYCRGWWVDHQEGFLQMSLGAGKMPAFRPKNE
jgi:hypothetical protein